MGKEIYDLMSNAPDTQLEKSMKSEFSKLNEISDVKEQAEGTFDALNKIVHGGLASDFIVMVLRLHLESVCKHEDYDFMTMNKESIERMKKVIK